MFKSRLGMILMICAGVFVGITNYSYAQYTGPGGATKPASTKDKIKSALGFNETGQDVMTVKELKKNPIYDKEIVLKGKIVKKTGTKEYRFEDDTGHMPMIIEDKFFLTKKVSDQTPLEITGLLTKKPDGSGEVFNVVRMTVTKK